MPTRPNPPSDPATAEAIGEIRGQLRELVHTMNNQGQRNELITKMLTKLENMPEQLAKIEARLVALETDKHRREGAGSVLLLIMKSPAFGWLVGAAVTVWALLSGKVE